eukprot:scaffold5885_cov201-Amphora_coffeaeformis.AAC.11
MTTECLIGRRLSKPFRYMNTFFLNGIPPFGKRSGSRSRGSVSKEKHDDAVLFERTFGMFSDVVLCRQDTPALWYMYYDLKGGSNDWGSESDIQGLVKQVLQSAICTVGLAAKIKCFNELSIFDLRPDIWIVCTGGNSNWGGGGKKKTWRGRR